MPVVNPTAHAEAEYYEALPLHSSQQELVKDAKEYCISLRLYVTRDLVMKIISYGDTVKVLQPELLASEIENEMKRTLKNYQQ